ncbi:MAG: repressor LexA [Rhodothermales bacterium]|nr:repressor LexA [Rhodothermales bacterium]
MSRKQLTQKQHAFLQFLAEHVRKHKVWPTYREIVDHFGYRSPNSVTQNLQALAKKGYLQRDQNGYRLVGQRAGLGGGGFPVQGRVQEGAYETALTIDELTLKDLFPGLNQTFAVQLDGSAARGIEADDGDYVLLTDDDVQNGEMATVLHGGTLCVCRVYRDNGGYRLQHTDGTEDHVEEDADGFELLGRYAGHVNRRGIFRLPGSRTVAYDVDATVSTTAN